MKVRRDRIMSGAEYKSIDFTDPLHYLFLNVSSRTMVVCHISLFIFIRSNTAMMNREIFPANDCNHDLVLMQYI